LPKESARLYPEFVHELEDESGMKVDLRAQGTILLSSEGHFPEAAEPISLEKLQAAEPALGDDCAFWCGPGGRGRPPYTIKSKSRQRT